MNSFLLQLKCKRYWPESKDEILTFAGLEISLVSSDFISFHLLDVYITNQCTVYKLCVSLYAKGSNPASFYACMHNCE